MQQRKHQAVTFILEGLPYDIVIGIKAERCFLNAILGNFAEAYTEWNEIMRHLEEVPSDIATKQLICWGKYPILAAMGKNMTLEDARATYEVLNGLPYLVQMFADFVLGVVYAEHKLEDGIKMIGDVVQNALPMHRMIDLLCAPFIANAYLLNNKIEFGLKYLNSWLLKSAATGIDGILGRGELLRLKVGDCFSLINLLQAEYLIAKLNTTENIDEREKLQEDIPLILEAAIVQSQLRQFRIIELKSMITFGKFLIGNGSSVQIRKLINDITQLTSTMTYLVDDPPPLLMEAMQMVESLANQLDILRNQSQY